ncbi:translocation/assembly module TamB domain-containing protein [Aridibaculum aurantiacum]|uniref:translocation/assembly module TamB domain-containing protein n=1 Tax=Aridibaculum aurantiacum TaxID=2810307 RepID=UPI001A97A94D
MQNFARGKIVTFLENKLQTKVAIKRLDIDFPKMLVLEGVYIEDRTKDTLLAGNQLKVDIAMFKLLNNEVQINEINLNGITLKVKRQLPDTIFNYQFIIDAFATQQAQPATKDTAAMKMAIDKIIIDDTRLVYFDVVTGNDVDVYLGHFDTRIDKFDPDNLVYDVPSINLRGVKGRVKQTAPLEVTVAKTDPTPTVANAPQQFVKFTNRETKLHDIDIAYSNGVSALDTRFKFRELNIYPENIDLENFLVAIREIELNELDGHVTMNAPPQGEVVQLKTQTGKEVEAEYLPWKFTVGAIRFNKNNFAFNDNTKRRTGRGMDYAHLGITDLTLHADDFLFNQDTIAGNIISGSMREQSGFVLNELTTDFRYTSRGATLNNLLIRTPGTELKRSAAVRYPSLAALEMNMNLMELNLDIDNSRVMVKDILTFAPDLASQPAFRNPNAILYLNSRISGSMARLNIQELQFRGFQNTKVDISGTLANATDPNAFSADLNIRNISTSRSDVLSFVPPKSIPNNITIPEAMALSGTVRGGASSTYANLSLNTSLGGAKVHGRINNAMNPAAATYAADISTSGLNVGRIIQQPQTVGTVSLGFTVRGRGFDPERANASIKGLVRSAQYNGYTYRNLDLNATLANQKFTANAAMQDPNLHFALQAEGDMGGSLPGFAVTATIDSIKTGPLNLTPDPMIYRGKIVANFPELNLDALSGQIYLTNSLLVANNQRIKLDSVEVLANYEAGQQLITAKTDFVTATLSGQYKLAQLGDIFIDAIQPYYAINTTPSKTIPDPYNFTINAHVIDHPTLKAFIPDLKRMDDIAIDANFSSADGWNADVRSPMIVLGTNRIADMNLTATTAGDRLQIETNVGEISAGENLSLLGTRLRANINDNKVDFALRVGDKAGKDKYRLQGLFAQEPNDLFSLSLRPDSLMLNYDVWSINNDNLIRFGADLVNANNFNLSKGDQQLLINSQGTTATSPMEVRFNNFRLATLTGFVQVDTAMADGTLNGNILLRDLTTQPNFTTDLTINNLAINRDTIGDVNAKIDNRNANVFATNVTITGRGNDVALTGNYYLKPQNNSNMDLNLAIRALQLETLEGASMGSIRDAHGYMSGNVKIGGTAASPDIDGRINFNDTRMVVSMLGNEFKIDNEAIVAVDNRGLRFDRFTIRDSAENRLTINGTAATTNFMNYNFDLGIRARNFRALNSTKRDNELFYGQLYFDTDLHIGGTETSPVIDGSLKVNEDTRMTVVLPQSQPGVVEREGIVVFVDKDDPLSDSLFLAAIDTLNRTRLVGMDLTANIEVDKKAELNLVIDEGNGDFVKLKGEANLTGGVDKSGKVTLTGSYELEAGSYEMSFNFLRRRFDIQKGSTITWTGEPTDANLDITAVYVANTSAIELVQDQVPAATRDLRFRQRLPFQVHLNMEGELMRPTLTFDIVLPEESSVRVDNEIAGYVETRLNQLKSEPSELNKQVFALLLLNRFVSENPFESSGGGTTAGTLARQSVSRMLTEQLNNMTENLIAGVDLNFDLVSTEDYTTGELRNRTDLNVAVSKRLLNDRLNVSVGRNFELEGGQQTNQGSANNTASAPDINIEYFLTRDGRYLLRAYRRNEFEGVVEGYVLETGVGFAVNVDYNRFKEIFERRRDRRAMARERRRERLEHRNTPAPEQPANPQGSSSTKSEAALDTSRKDENEN